MTWSILTGGRPPTTGHIPSPHAFLVRLFGEVAGVDVNGCVDLAREEFDEIAFARGYCGDPTTGYVWDSEIPTETVAGSRTEESYVTYGLPGAALIWSVSFPKRRRWELDEADWRCERLVASLDDLAGQVVGRLWAELFGTRPVFGPAPATQDYDAVVRHSLDRLRADLIRTGRAATSRGAGQEPRRPGG